MYLNLCFLSLNKYNGWLQLSLIHVGVDPARSQEGVEAGVDEVASIEGAGETLWSWEEFGWQVLLLWDLCAILLVGSLVDEVLLQSLFWILDLISFGWELTWNYIFTLNLLIVVFNSTVDLSIELTMFSHFF